MSLGDQTRLFELLKQATAYSDEDIEDLRRTAGQLTNSGMDFQALANVRAAILVMDAIRKFDKASTKLGYIVLAFTLVATLAGIVQATFAVLGYYWPR